MGLRSQGAEWNSLLEENLLALVIDADGLLVKVNKSRTGNGIRDNKRRRSKVVSAYKGVDSAFEVSVAREHAGNDEVTLLSGTEL